GGVVPRVAAVVGVSAVAVAVTAPVVVLARDHVVRVVGVDRDCRLVLRLAAAGEVRIGDVLAVLVHLDVVAELLRAGPGAGREVTGGVRRRRAARRRVRRRRALVVGLVAFVAFTRRVD